MRRRPITDLSTLSVGDTVLFCGEVAGSFFDEDEAVLVSIEEYEEDEEEGAGIDGLLYYFDALSQGYSGWCVMQDDVGSDNIQSISLEPSGLTKFLEGI